MQKTFVFYYVAVICNNCEAEQIRACVRRCDQSAWTAN